MTTYKEFLKSLDSETDDDDSINTKDQIGLILYSNGSFLSVSIDNMWNIPIDYIKFLEDKTSSVCRFFRQLVGKELRESKLNLISAKMNDCGGKLYIYSYECKSNIRVNGFVSENYDSGEWFQKNKLPRPFSEITKEYIL